MYLYLYLYLHLRAIHIQNAWRLLLRVTKLLRKWEGDEDDHQPGLIMLKEDGRILVSDNEKADVRHVRLRLAPSEKSQSSQKKTARVPVPPVPGLRQPSHRLLRGVLRDGARPPTPVPPAEESPGPGRHL